MRINAFFTWAITATIGLFAAILLLWNTTPTVPPPAVPSAIGDAQDPNARVNHDLERLADPATGTIPAGIRQRELAFVRQLPVNVEHSRRNSAQYEQVGPFNVGGRTRAAALDVTDEQVILAGGVSGGLWRTTDQGTTWTKITDPSAHQSITCIAQDTRPGQTDVWYYGSGEGIGNSANASFSAPYQGNGVYKSTDGGLTWNSLTETVSGTPQTGDEWDIIWQVAIDPSNTTEDVVYAAVPGRIFRSSNGGTNWTAVLESTGFQSSAFSDIAVTPSGVAYATFSQGGGNNGIWRSENGTDWTNIDPSFMPTNFNRVVLTVDPNDANIVYFMAVTPGSGKVTQVFFGGTAANSLWKYEYQSGDGTGAGGQWTDLSDNLPDGFGDFGNFNTQGGYDMVVSVKPGDPNTIFVGGTNLYRSTDGFTSPNNTDWIGGYEPFTTLPYFEIYDQHHPDQHGLLFLPSDADKMISYHDGGLALTSDNTANTVSWSSLNNGYVTAQLYTVAIDHQTQGSNEVICGTQDNGSWWTNSSDPNFQWTMPSTGDGAFCAIADGGNTHYFSRQRGKMLKMELDGNGLVTGFTRIDPAGGSQYLFINPFILDPVDNNVMYLAEGPSVWRNDDLASIALNNQYDSITTGWLEYSNSSVATNQRVTALAASVNPAHRLYYGTNSKNIFRVDDANTGDPNHQSITTGIGSGGYTNCIAVDPRDADKVFVVFSNYNTYSLYYSEDGGMNWEQVAGNLEAEPDAGVPPGLGIGDGPSLRWISVIPVSDGTIYLVGTSAGLFATDTIMGDSTEWIAQAPNSVGRVVVDMLDARVSDGFVAIGTHGNGVYTTQFTSVNDIIPTDFPTSTAQSDIQSTATVYPNPASDQINFSFSTEQASRMKLVLYDATGRKAAPALFKQANSGTNTWTVPVNQLAAGWYTYQLTGGEKVRSGQFLVQQ